MAQGNAAVTIRPLGNKILVRRLEGHGIERVTKGGIVVPATAEKHVRTKADYFRARVEAIGPEAERALPDLAQGSDVLVYTYSGTDKSVFTGTDIGERGLFVEPDDILCVAEGE
jgi:co-chaperonin GroES (HSP10)